MSPTAAETTATGSHHDVCLNTPHAATLKPAIAAKARTLTTVHRGPVGGGVRPTKDAVIHRNVVPNRKNAAAETFLKVNMGSSSQCLLAGTPFSAAEFATMVEGPESCGP